MRRILGFFSFLLAITLAGNVALAAPESHDGVCEVWSSASGTGTAQLSGSTPVGGYTIFVNKYTSGATVAYRLTQGTGASRKIEVGEGVFTDAAPDTLTRATIYYTTDVVGGGTPLTLDGSDAVLCAAPITDWFQLGGGSSNWSPNINNGAALGESGLGWADLWFATGGTIEFDGGTTNTFLCSGGTCSIEGVNLLKNIVEDTTPQAGGQWDWNGQTQLDALLTNTIVLDFGEDEIQLTNDADGITGVQIDSHHDSATPAAGDIPLDFRVFAGTDDEEVGRIVYQLDDGATTTEDGQWRFFVDVAGVSAQQAAIGNGVIIGPGTTFPGAGNLLATEVIVGGDTTQTGNLQVGGTSGDSSSMGIGRFSADANDGDINFVKSRGATVGSHGLVSNNDQVGNYAFYVSDGNSFEQVAGLKAYVDGVAADGDTPGRLELSTTADGGTTLSTRLTIKNDGGVIIGPGTTSPGVGNLFLDTGSLYADEQAAAGADTAAWGQFWVRNDAPNTPMFTGDTGEDQVLGSIPFVVAASDETTVITTGTDKATFRAPFALTVTGVRCGLNVAQTGGSLFTVDINENNVTILSTKLTFDNNETTTTTAATAAVISDTAIADDAEIEIDVDTVGTGSPAGLKCTLITKRAA